jgi:hypothetical protein
LISVKYSILVHLFPFLNTRGVLVHVKMIVADSWRRLPVYLPKQRRNLQRTGIVRLDRPGKKILHARPIALLPDLQEELRAGLADAIGIVERPSAFDNTAVSQILTVLFSSPSEK